MRDQAKSPGELRQELKKLSRELAKASSLAARNAKTAEARLDQIKRLKEALRKFRRSGRRMTEQERMQALGQMASGVVHDFNNALTPILSASDYLLTNPKVMENEAHASVLLESIRTAARDARDMILRLREFYHTGKEVEILPVDLNPLVEQTLSFAEQKWKEEGQTRMSAITVRTELEHVPRVMANDSRFREVLTNLIFNAVEAMPDGGTLTIHTRPHGRRVLLEISDTGKGMTDEVRARCFEPFFSTKGSKGMGMGLAMVYGIIHSHLGKIDIRSELGQGTTFIISLPAQKQKA